MRDRNAGLVEFKINFFDLADCMADSQKTYGKMACLWGSAKTYEEMRQAWETAPAYERPPGCMGSLSQCGFLQQPRAPPEYERRRSMSAAGLDGVKAHHETAWPVGNRRTVWKRGPCGDPRRVGSNRIKDSENQIELLGLVSVSDTFDSAGGAQRLIRMDRSITCGKPECSSHGTFRSRREEEGF